MTEARIPAEIRETQTVIDADEHQTFSADNQITVSNFLTRAIVARKYRRRGSRSVKNLCRPSNDNMISTTALRIDTKITSDVFPKCNPRENKTHKSHVTMGTEPETVLNGTPSYMPSRFVTHPAALFQSYTNPADATYNPQLLRPNGFQSRNQSITLLLSGPSRALFL